MTRHKASWAAIVAGTIVFSIIASVDRAEARHRGGRFGGGSWGGHGGWSHRSCGSHGGWSHRSGGSWGGTYSSVNHHESYHEDCPTYERHSVGYHQDYSGDVTYGSGSTSIREEIAGHDEPQYESGDDRRDRFESTEGAHFRGRVSAPVDPSRIGSSQDEQINRDGATESNESRVAERPTTDEGQNATVRDGNPASSEENDESKSQQSQQQETQTPTTQSSESSNENQNQPNSEVQ